MGGILVANRGEIALRIVRAAAELGLRTAAVHTRDDAGSPHTRRADEVRALPGEGVAGYLDANDHPVIRSTERTRNLVIERNQTPPDPDRVAAVKGAVMLSAMEPTIIDLGGRSVKLIPRGGHTDSDVTLELDDPSIVFCGDLVWNSMFPNFVDTVPTKMIASVKAFKRARATAYVPGHGPLAKPGAAASSARRARVRATRSSPMARQARSSAGVKSASRRVSAA